LENEGPLLAETAVSEESSPSGDEQFEQGLKALNTGNLVFGIDLLMQFAQAQRRHPKADNALYYSGVGFMGLENLDSAMLTFQRVLEEYPAGDAVRESLMKLGECHVKRNHIAAARDIFEKVARQYQGSQVSLEAHARLKNLEASRPTGKPSPTKQEE
jgi:TolA-binding protein